MDINQSAAGVIDGYENFRGNKCYLQIKFGGSGTGEIQSLSYTNSANDGGYFRLGTRDGKIDVQDMPYNSSTTAIATRVNALTGHTPSVSGGFDGASPVTFTFDHKASNVSDNCGRVIVASHSLTDGGVAEIFTGSSVTQNAVVGFDTSASYTLEVYMYYFKCLEVDKRGKVKCYKMTDNKYSELKL